MYVSPSYPIELSLSISEGRSLSVHHTVRPFLTYLLALRITTAASGWKRVGTDAWPNDEPDFHLPGMVGLLFFFFGDIRI